MAIHKIYSQAGIVQMGRDLFFVPLKTVIEVPQ